MPRKEKAEIIVKRANSLSVEERVAIVREIEDSINKDRRIINVGKRYQFLLPLAEKAVGHQMRPEKRDMLDVRVRMFVAYRLRTEGYFLSAIGGAMGMDHSSIYHLFDKMRDMFLVPMIYKEEIHQYKEFENLISQENSSSV